MVFPSTAPATRVASLASWAQRPFFPHWFLLSLWQFTTKKGDVYNILWALVFGFATINILSLVGRRLDPDRRNLNFGELLAILVVAVSVLLLGWEMLFLFKILPIKLQPR
ncbi:MAG TPA: hypothetical protein VK555_13145 [Terriglobales bacterium]|nr:hypothetical protein [Terriglobales bacterium]